MTKTVDCVRGEGDENEGEGVQNEGRGLGEIFQNKRMVSKCPWY